MTALHDMDKQPEFMRKQFEFAAYVRNPDKYARPEEIETRRMKVYADLFYNNVESFMANTYRVLRAIMDDTQWHALIRDYFENHHAHTPLFPEMPREFLRYLEDEREPQESDPPFMLELAHYEWTELALTISEEEFDDTGIDKQGDLLNGIPALSPLAWPLSFAFPVHQINEENQPQQPPETPTYLIAYRDREFDVHFLETNPVTARLIQLISENSGHTGQELLAQIAEEIGHPQPEVVIRGGGDILDDLRKRDVILGTNIQIQPSG